MNPIRISTSILLLVIASTQPTNAPFVAFDTGTPPSPFGTDGFDVNAGQSVAMRFFNNIDGSLTSIGVWMMSNGGNTSTINVTLVEGNETTPSLDVLEQFASVPVNTAGWNPILVQVNSTAAPELIFGHFYWIVLTSNSDPDPVWCQSNTLAYGTMTNGNSSWQPGGSAQSAAVKVVAQNNGISR